MTGQHGSAQRVAIVGGGLAGSLLALALSERGYHVDVFERRFGSEGDLHGRVFFEQPHHRLEHVDVVIDHQHSLASLFVHR